MKPAIVLLVAACVLSFAADARITYGLSVKGALARVAFKVVDQDGAAVPGAKVWGGFSDVGNPTSGNDNCDILAT